ncbi:LysR substrate-binding domain-containing protein [Pusillimonas caeni]|uniref:LysR substrate-binding domain-containing protein n=1 Tax=Pusillimonas caeni TaxID=1348472 RepID=UPI001430D2C3|nr:LysR substrate-binding domain-containing protein [Pusillimonas caeni]
MRLQQLELLIALGEKGSLRAAAEQLNVTQPALSKSLRQLEEEFGIALVQRSAKGARLAPAGELLAARAATALRELDRAREDIALHLGNTAGQVTLGMSPAVAILFSPGATARFASRWPGVKLCMRDALYPHALRQLRSGELDFVLGPVPAAGVGSDLLRQPLFHSQEIIAARRGHPLSRARRLADLVDARWILTGPTHGPGDPAHLRFEALGLRPPHVELECESFSTLLGLMSALDVVGIMPRSFLDRHGRRAGLVALPIEDPLPVTTIYAVLRADAPLTLPAQDLLEAFLQEAREFSRAQDRTGG